MNMTILGILSIVILFLLMIFRFPVSFSMLIVGFIGIYYASSLESAVNMLTADLWSQLSSYSLSVIPLFILMGELIYRSGISVRLFDTAHKWAGHFRGGMASATILASAGFSMISGSNSATAATMGTIALPELKKYGYDDKLSAGSVASGGTLGVIIPPSTVLIVLAIQTEQSIRELFLAIIVPSAILVILFLLLILLMMGIKPTLGPASEKVCLKERLISLQNVLPVVLLFIFVIGGMFLGWFTPTESAAFGSFGALILTFRRLTFKKFKEALVHTLRSSAMVVFLIVGAMIFGRLLTLTRLPYDIAHWVETINTPNVIILIFILLIYAIGGSLMDAMGFLIISLPIFFPVALAMGYDPVWFSILVCIITSMGAITPPVGVNVFIVGGLRRDLSIVDIFKGTMPFLIPYVILVAILIALPEIITFIL